MKIPPAAIVRVGLRRWVRLNSKNEPEVDANRGVGWCLHPDDKPDHGRAVKR